MAGNPPRFDDDEDDASSRYLRRLQGGDDEASGEEEAETEDPSAASPSRTAPPQAPRLRPPAPAGFAENAPSLPFPGAPPPGWSAEELPPGAPVNLVSADVVPPGQANLRQIPTLPTWFFSDGLKLLREGNYTEAAQYYEALTHKSPDDPEGWYGLGAAWQGKGNVNQAVACYVKGFEVDRHLFPVAALAIEARPGQPAQLFNLAQALAQQSRRRALKTAITLLEEVMASPVTPRNLYMKADAARRKVKNDLEWVEAADNPAMMSMKKAALREQFIRRVLAAIFLVLVSTGLGFVGYFVYCLSRGESTYQKGMLVFLDGYKMATFGTSTRQAADSRDAFELYKEALDLFQLSSEYRPKSIPSHFMVIKSGQQVLRHMAAHYGTEKIPPDLVKKVRGQLQKAEAQCKVLDPTGVEVRHEQALLDARLVTVR